MFKQILVAVSGGSDLTALSTASRLAREYRASVTVLHVVNWMLWIPGAEFQDFGMTLAHAEEHGQEIVANASKWLKEAGCSADVHMMTMGTWDGSVGKAIADFARDKCVDLIVLGRRPANWWQHWAEENVSAQVERYASVPVLIASDGKMRRSSVAMPWSKPAATL
jgi:nucleotide-binding universal stress UspA family protein